MRHVKTRKGGRITFGRVEWLVIPVGSHEPCAAGVDFYADKYYEDEMQMPLWRGRGSGIKADAYAHRSSAYVACGKYFHAATHAEAWAFANDHSAQCDDCKDELDA